MIIALAYKKGVGKDTAGSLILDIYPGLFKRLSIAARLKIGCAKMFNIPEWVFNDEILKDTPINEGIYTPRQLLQQTAESLRNKFGEDAFIKSLGLTDAEAQYGGIVITDCRFKNEVSYIKSKGGKVVRVDRSDAGSDAGYGEHDLDDYMEWDYVLDNNGSLEELEARIKTMMIKLYGLTINTAKE